MSCSKKEQTDENNKSSGNPLFELIDSNKSNIVFNNHIEENFKNFFAIFNYVYNGAGVAIGDINNDGLSDIYFVGNEVPDKLYLNKGNFVFEYISEKAHISGYKGWHNEVVMADVNGDGFQDIYVCRGGYHDTDEECANLLFINQGNSTFKEQAKDFGLNDIGYSVMASFFDMDNDIDVYVTNRPNTFFIGYQQVLECKIKQDDLFRDKLFQNVNGKFIDISKIAEKENLKVIIYPFIKACSELNLYRFC